MGTTPVPLRSVGESSTTASPWSRVVAYFRGRFNRPLYTPGGRVSPQAEIILSALVCMCGVSALSFTMAGKAIDWSLLWVFAVGCIIAESMVIRFSSTAIMTCVDMFFAAAFVSLPLADGAALILVVSLWVAFHHPDSLQETIVQTSWATGPVVVCLFVTHAVVEWTSGSPWVLVPFLLGGLTAWIVLRCSEVVYYGIFGLVQPTDAGWSGRLGNVRIFLHEGSREFAPQMVAHAPMGVLGAIAWQISPVSILLLLSPFVVSWRLGRQAAHLEDAQRKMRIDPLTGLSNRIGFYEATIRHIESPRFACTFGIIMGDLDNFKMINDTLGHNGGDNVLALAARALRDGCTGTNDVICRYGGEEFVVLAPHRSTTELLELAEALRRNIYQAVSEFGTSISLGVAEWRPGEGIEELVGRADKALYSAKFAGKNCVHHITANDAVVPSHVDRAIPDAA